MKLALARSGPPVSAPALLRTALAVDLLLSVACVLHGAARAAGLLGLGANVAAGAGAAAYGVLAVVADVAAARMSPPGLTWRRRLGYAAIVAALWRGSPWSEPATAVAVVLWSGFVWVALVVGGRALSRAIASATGEDKPE